MEVILNGETMRSLLATDSDVRIGPASTLMCSENECETMRVVSDRWEREKEQSAFFSSLTLVLVKFITRVAQMFSDMSGHGSMRFSISFLTVVSEIWYRRVLMAYSRKYSKSRQIEKLIFSLR
jgi:hypothetical protein